MFIWEIKWKKTREKLQKVNTINGGNRAGYVFDTDDEFTTHRTTYDTYTEYIDKCHSYVYDGYV